MRPTRRSAILALGVVGAGALWGGPAIATTGHPAAASTGAPGPVSAAAPAPGQPSSTTAIPVDRQDYVTAYTTQNPEDGSTVDPYDGDPSSIHVAVSGGQEFARSFVHLALDYLPTGAVATDAGMTLYVTQQSDASSSGVYPLYNVNTSQAIVQACVLTSELPPDFNPQDPPPYNCELGSSVGKPSSDGTMWTFDLKDLVRYWDEHGNTGAALVPVGSGDPSQTWQVAFYKSRSSSQVTYVSPASPPGQAAPSSAPSAAAGGEGTAGTTGAPSPASQSPAGAQSSSDSSTPSGAPSVAVPSGSAAGSYGPIPATAPAASSRSSTSATGATAGPAGVAAGNPGTTVTRPSGRSGPAWPWVLLGCLAVALGAVALAHRQVVLAALPRGWSIWRTHPRAYSVAAAAVTWGIVFGAYSAATSPPGQTVTAGGTLPSTQAGTGSTGGSTSAPGGASGSGSARPASNGGSGTAASLTAGGTSVAGSSAGTSTGGSTSGGTGASVAGPSVTGPAEFTGAGTWKTINGVRVFFPAAGGPPEAQLYSGSENTVGITPSRIELCAHAALTYGAAFNISASDLDVYWDYVNAHGGIFDRQVHGDFENDNYDPGTAVQAAQTCKDLDTFFLIGGIGFDQIPAVRQWAEQNHELYLHHIATIEGSQGLRYSFSALPTVEQVGTWFGQLVIRQFAGEKVGIIYRDSSNWTPGVDTFTKTIEAAGIKVVGSYGVQINQGNYTQELTELRTAGAQVILSWENALAEVEMIKQAEAQNWHPAWLVNPFNLITNTLGSNALDQDIWGVAEWDAYDPGYYGGGFNSYADQIHQFEAQYKQYDPNADLSGDGGDLLFLNWEAQKYIDALLTACGPDCTRNKVAGLLLAGFDENVPPNCPVNFGLTDDHHHGGYTFNVLHDVKDPNGRANFVPVARCVTSY